MKTEYQMKTKRKITWDDAKNWIDDIPRELSDGPTRCKVRRKLTASVIMRHGKLIRDSIIRD